MLEAYRNRPAYAVPVSFTLDREAAAFLRQIAGQKNLGRIVSRLVLEERARIEERQRIGTLLIEGVQQHNGTHGE